MNMEQQALDKQLDPEVQGDDLVVTSGKNKQLDRYVRQVVSHFKDGTSIQVEDDGLLELDERLVREAIAHAINSRHLDSFDQLVMDLVSFFLSSRSLDP